MKIFIVLQITKLISRKKLLIVNIYFCVRMFEFKELKLMFLDPIDLVINYINKYLNKINIIRIIFS